MRYEASFFDFDTTPQGKPSTVVMQQIDDKGRDGWKLFQIQALSYGPSVQNWRAWFTREALPRVSDEADDA